MIIKKYTGTSENELMLQIKEELGSGAIIMNVKTMKPKGMFRFLRKEQVEITAAVEDSVPTKEHPKSKEESVPTNYANRESAGNRTKDSKKQTPVQTSAIEEKLNTLADMIEKQITAEKQEAEEMHKEPEQEQKESTKETSRIAKLLYQQFLDNEVKEEYAKMLVEEIDDMPDKEEVLDAVLSKVYQRIVLKLGEPEQIVLEKGHPKVCFFVGSTGVGKTTTIAKIASVFKLEQKANVALVTSDTYRIAAVEQLKTYANILSIPIRVVYTPQEMKTAIKDYEAYDLILVDTAGRSPKNEEQRKELQSLLDSVDDSMKEVYLVLNGTTKYNDLREIVSVYQDMADVRIIFSKLDETNCYGNILNIRLDTGAPLSYITCGQVVPDDIALLNAQTIAKQLLGG